jgi:hypothetical protein
LTRKHYIAMADELRETHRQLIAFAESPKGLVGISVKGGGVTTLEVALSEMERAVARVFAADNPRFDFRRFMDRVAAPR